MRIFLIVIAMIILLAASASGFIFYNQLQQYKAELASLEKRIEVVKGQIDQAKEKIAQLELKNGLLQQKISDSQTKISGYNSQVLGLNSKKDKSHSELQNQQAQLASLKAELNNLAGEKGALDAMLNELMSKHKNTDDEIMILSNAKKELEEDIKKYLNPASGVELEKIVVKLSQVSDGAIVETNEKYGFAMIDIGTDNGAIVGDIFGVYRNNELVAKVIVDKAFKDFSSVVPTEGYTDTKLKVSDKVSLMR